MPEAPAKEEREYLWQFDERGSLNAVCGHLRSLGVRWYLPGELGEVVPKMKSIPLPKLDDTVKDSRLQNYRIGFCRQLTAKMRSARQRVRELCIGADPSPLFPACCLSAVTSKR